MGRAPGTVKRWSAELYRFVARAGDREFHEIGSGDLELGILAEWETGFRARNGRAPALNSTRAVIQALRSFYAFLEGFDLPVDGNGGLRRNPALALELPVIPVKPELDWLRADEDDALLVCPMNAREDVSVFTLRMTGLRRGPPEVRPAKTVRPARSPTSGRFCSCICAQCIEVALERPLASPAGRELLLQPGDLLLDPFVLLFLLRARKDQIGFEELVLGLLAGLGPVDEDLAHQLDVLGGHLRERLAIDPRPLRLGDDLADLLEYRGLAVPLELERLERPLATVLADDRVSIHGPKIMER